MFNKLSYVTSAICGDVVVKIKSTLTSLSHSNMKSALLSDYIQLGNHPFSRTNYLIHVSLRLDRYVTQGNVNKR